MKFAVLLTVLLFLFAPTLSAQDAKPVATAEEVLAEVNALRAQRGLPPYILDVNLTRGAVACAEYRARHGISGHTHSDFSFLPAGVRASAAGCAAWPLHLGFGACCVYDRYTYAGAGWCVKDGVRFCQLFVR